MRKHACSFGLLAAALSGVAAAQWQQVWSEEFDVPGLNTAVWEPLIGTGTAYGLPAGWGNNELQYYTNFSSNVSVSNGTLKITALRQNFGGRSFTSARLRTRGAFEFRWGRVEARMKLPSASGVWPALWLLPTNSPYGGWASSGEIDIMESVNNADRIYGTIHFGAPSPGNTSNGGSIVTGADFSQGFHTYAVEWEPNEIRWYLDGVQFHSVSFTQWFSTAAPGNPRAPFDTPFHLIANVAVGGNFPGDPSPGAVYPQTLEIDWIRVSQRVQQPLFGAPTEIPGLIEAEHYDLGYPGEAFSDTDVGNNGGAFRQDDVDMQTCSEGGFNLGWMSPGEWTEYTVDVKAPGRYRLEARVSSGAQGGTFRVESDGRDLTGTLTAPATGGWQRWTTVSANVTLRAGVQTLRLRTITTPGGYNVNWIRISPCSRALVGEVPGRADPAADAFVRAFRDQDPYADLAEPIGELDYADVAEFLRRIWGGCE